MKHQLLEDNYNVCACIDGEELTFGNLQLVGGNVICGTILMWSVHFTICVHITH